MIEGGSTMKVLVAVASKHGSTRQIAGAIVEELRNSGTDADLRDMSEVSSVRGYDAIILGSAVYMGTWLPEARSFPDHHRVALSKIPIWLFSSGPLGADDPQPHDDPMRLIPTTLAAPISSLDVRDHRVFVGKLDQAGLGFGERIAVKMVRAALGDYRAPYGDFRDWDDIRSWAREIATELHSVGAVAD
jgi:menaquinone-dependent protoporphyrinogen oxidase